MPSLLVQLDSAANGTGVVIGDFKPGPLSTGNGAGSGGASGGSTPAGGGNNPAAPGAPPAQGFPAKQAQHAGQAVTQANGVNQAHADAANGQQGTPSSSPSVPGLESVPLTFTMTGSYFNLADFFHRLKRFVQVVNNQIVVNGRLMTIESFSFQQGDAKNTSQLKADVSATIYLTPPDQGTTAGAFEAWLTLRGIQPDRHRNAMTTFLLDLWQDLRAKRLWPVAVALVVAMLAVPLVLSKSASSPAPPTGGGQATGASKLPTVALDASSIDTSHLDVFGQKNPFASNGDKAVTIGAPTGPTTPAAAASKAGGTSGTAASTASGGTSASSSGSSSSGGGGGSSASGPASPGVHYFTYTADVRFGPTGTTRSSPSWASRTATRPCSSSPTPPSTRTGRAIASPAGATACSCT